MDKKLEVIFGFGVIVIVIIGFIVAVIKSVPTDEERAKYAQNVVQPKDLDEDILSEIRNLTKNGDIPVKKPSAEELNHENPFLPTPTN